MHFLRKKSFVKRSLSFLLFVSFFSSLLSCSGQNVDEEGEKVTIAYAEALSSFSPLNYQSNNRKYLSNIYETLVRYDNTFNYDTSLATSWGRIDDYTWEFRLRTDVYFHDGTTFDASDVIYSLEAAIHDENSQLSSLLGNIASVEESDDGKVIMKTKKVDPLFLNKLVNVYIFPAGYLDFKAPVGTGPYLFYGYEDNVMNLKRFDYYWGAKPYFAEAALQSILNPEDRVKAIRSGSVNVLANIPPQSAETLRAENIQIVIFPSLELSSIMFNFERIFADDNLREAVSFALSTDFAEKFGAGYLLPTNQFAAFGIFGYSKRNVNRIQDLEKAMEIRLRHEGTVDVVFDIPIGLEKLAEQVVADLKEIDINVTVNPLSATDLQDKIVSGQSDMYFFGWKYDLADVSDFFEVVIHGKVDNYGAFNGMGYINEDVDAKIEEAGQILDINRRRVLLDAVSEQILQDQVGIPLFEAELLYGVRPEYIWKSRSDGLILASEISKKGV